MTSIVAGYFALVALTPNPAWGDGGETWFSLLIEAPFWIGVPALTSGGLGAFGWYLAGLATRNGRATS